MDAETGAAILTHDLLLAIKEQDSAVSDIGKRDETVHPVGVIGSVQVSRNAPRDPRLPVLPDDPAAAAIDLPDHVVVLFGDDDRAMVGAEKGIVRYEELLAGPDPISARELPDDALT